MARCSKSKQSAKATRTTKAKRVLRQVAARTASQPLPKPRPQAMQVDELEANRMKARLERNEETKKRNADAQSLPEIKRRKKTSRHVDSSDDEKLERDKQDFFDAIDAVLYRICGSCGELAISDNAKLKLYDPKADFFTPLCNDSGECENFSEGLVGADGAEENSSIWLCCRCYRSLVARKTPKFCRSSGFRIGVVPRELAELNRIECRLIGLGISFTTCVNLYRDGQEFSRGNAINYWNEPSKLVNELPCPLKECGVVFLSSRSDISTSYFRVRPDLVRRALCWLIANNPLYGRVQISEENLRALEQFDINRDVPTIPVTEDEVQELRGQVNQVNREERTVTVEESQNSCTGGVCEEPNAYSSSEQTWDIQSDISARHFSRRFQAFFDNILCGRAKPLGEIVDYFWRVEFQQRGSPHIHCLLWVKAVPDVLKLSETEEGREELAAFIDKHISVLSKTLKELGSCLCATCSTHKAGEIDILALRPPSVGKKEWECDLARLVHRVQQHHCHAGSSCRKKSNECRFGFPKTLQSRTFIETSLSSDGTPSLKIHLKRDVSTINNYSPHLLSC